MPGHKDAAVESLRGLALILMVAGHVIGSDAGRGIQVDDGSLWRIGYAALEDLRMPLFTALSGYVYALRPVATRHGYPILVRGKARRLLVPLLVVGALTFAVQLVVPGVHRPPEPAEAWRLLVFPFEHLWFLQSIFLIFLLVGLLDAVGKLARFGEWLALFAAACGLYSVVALPAHADVFSVTGAVDILPFFLLGLGLHRFGHLLDRARWLAWSLAVFACVYGLRLATLLTDADVPSPAERALSLGVGVAGLVSLFLLRRALTSRTLAWLGPFAFGAYLLHVFGTAGARILLERLGVESHLLFFVVGMAAGIGLPVLFQQLFARYALVSWLILGQKPQSAERPPAPPPVLAVPDSRAPVSSLRGSAHGGSRRTADPPSRTAHGRADQLVDERPPATESSTS